MKYSEILNIISYVSFLILIYLAFKCFSKVKYFFINTFLFFNFIFIYNIFGISLAFSFLKQKTFFELVTPTFSANYFYFYEGGFIKKDGYLQSAYFSFVDSFTSFNVMSVFISTIEILINAAPHILSYLFILVLDDSANSFFLLQIHSFYWSCILFCFLKFKNTQENFLEKNSLFGRIENCKVYSLSTSGPLENKNGEIEWEFSPSDSELYLDVDKYIIKNRTSFKELNMRFRFEIAPNKDKKFPATHIIEIIFIDNEMSEHGEVNEINYIAMKHECNMLGVQLQAASTKLTKSTFLIALLDEKGAFESNTDLLATMNWFELGVTRTNGHSHLLVFPKGEIGTLVFDKAFNSWSG